MANEATKKRVYTDHDPDIDTVVLAKGVSSKYPSSYTNVEDSLILAKELYHRHKTEKKDRTIWDGDQWVVVSKDIFPIREDHFAKYYIMDDRDYHLHGGEEFLATLQKDKVIVIGNVIWLMKQPKEISNG